MIMSAAVPTPSAGNRQYLIDRIGEKRVVNGRTEIILKWRGYSPITNTWIPFDNLQYHNIIEACEKSFQAEKMESKQNNLKGFARGLEPAKIMGATDASGELVFLMKWKDSIEADLVPAKEANIKCPQIVIQFYEEHITFHDDMNINDDNVFQQIPTMNAGEKED